MVENKPVEETIEEVNNQMKFNNYFLKNREIRYYFLKKL